MRWKTKDGKELDVSEMETSHIQNALNLLEKNGCISPKTLNFYLTCIPPTADMAMDCFEMEFAAVLEAPVSEFVDIFEDELEKRKSK